MAFLWDRDDTDTVVWPGQKKSRLTAGKQRRRRQIVQRPNAVPRKAAKNPARNHLSILTLGAAQNLILQRLPAHGFLEV
jgi:hypothetical protein